MRKVVQKVWDAWVSCSRKTHAYDFFIKPHNQEVNPTVTPQLEKTSLVSLPDQTVDKTRA